MSPTLQMARTLAAFATLASSVLAGGLPDPCQPRNNCHFSRWSPEGTPDGSQLGQSVAIFGNCAAVGAPGTQEVLIYERVDSTWSHVDTVPDPHAGNNYFGNAVSMTEDFLAIGAPYDDTVGLNSGAVHVYQRVGDAWVPDEVVYDATPTAGGAFGFSVSVDGPWLGVGAPDDSAVGHAHFFLRTIAAWELLSELDGWAGGDLGHSVAVRAFETELAAHFVMGDPESDVMGANAGAVVHATFGAAGLIWSQLLVTPQIVAGDRFGTAVAFDENRLVVGASGDDETAINGGAAYVYDVEPGEFNPDIVLAEKLLPCEPNDYTEFGQSLAVHGSTVAVGAMNQESGAEPGGRVYLFTPWIFGGAWQLSDVIMPSDGVINDYFGYSVALTDGLVLVGARGVGALAGAGYLVSTASNLDGGQCPCDDVAETVLYGTGKPGTVGVPVISAQEFVPNETTVLGVSECLPGVAPILMWGTIPAEIPMDNGMLLIGDPRLVNLPVVGGTGMVGIGIDVPNNLNLCGVSVYFQSLFLDPGADGEYHTAQTRGLRATLGY